MTATRICAGVNGWYCVLVKVSQLEIFLSCMWGDDGEGSVVSRESRRRKEREALPPGVWAGVALQATLGITATCAVCSLSSRFSLQPAGFVIWAQLGWKKQRNVTVVIKGNRSVLVLPVLWLIPGWQKRNGWISQQGFCWIMWKPSSSWDKQKSRRSFCSCLVACEITSD